MYFYDCFLQIRRFTIPQVIFRNCDARAHHLDVTLATALLKLGLPLVQRPLPVERESHLKQEEIDGEI